MRVLLGSGLCEGEQPGILMKDLVGDKIRYLNVIEQLEFVAPVALPPLRRWEFWWSCSATQSTEYMLDNLDTHACPQ